jgi:hypothetical protein
MSKLYLKKILIVWKTHILTFKMLMSGLFPLMPYRIQVVRSTRVISTIKIEGLLFDDYRRLGCSINLNFDNCQNKH